ncbi:hypothetical protein ACIO87_23200 [Streptomyces sp. NPDC087218]|uniref:hypothetical protein n=1 Tax=Streptomyces sp. NPDC087218 TaxID=3365769 RepID=UPI00381DFBB2
MATVRPALDPRGQALLDDWTGAVEGLAAARDRAEHLVREEARAAGTWMLTVLRRPALAAGLALASPGFTRELLRADPAEPPAPGTRLARTALAYLTRTAVKTSPFGSLTTLGLATLGPTPPDLLPASAANTAAAADTVSPRHLAVELLRAFATDPDLSATMEFRLNPSLRRIAGSLQVLLPQYLSSELPYRIDTLTGADLYAHLLPPAPDGADGDGARPLAAWYGGGTPGERGRAHRWAAAGLLLPDVPWQLHDRHCLAALADRTGTPAGPHGERVAAALGVLADTERRLPAADAATRLELDGRARTAAADVFAALDVKEPSWLASAPLFHENVPAADTPVPTLPAREIEHDLRVLGGHVRRRTTRTVLYGLMLRHFTARYGTGGTCRDLHDFLYSFCRREDHDRLLRQTTEHDRAAAGTDDCVPTPRGTVGAAAVTVFHQLAAADTAALHRGDYLMVVNRVSPGPAALMARWGAVPGIGGATRDPLRRWVRDLHPGCAVHQLTAGPDYSTLQAPAGPLFPALRWPSDLRAAGTAPRDPEAPGPDLDLGDLVLSHEPATDTLQLYGPGGVPVALPYLGVIPLHLLQGPVRLLATLSQPWVTRYLTNGERMPYDPDSPPPEGVTARDRVRQGRLVTARASWRLPVSALPRPEKGERTAEFLDRLDVWRRASGIPQECFVRTATMTPGVLPEKPFWTHLGSPHAVASLLKAVAAGVDVVEFIELLPGPGQHWLTDADGRPRTVELAALLRLDHEEETR